MMYTIVASTQTLRILRHTAKTFICHPRPLISRISTLLVPEYASAKMIKVVHGLVGKAIEKYFKLLKGYSDDKIIIFALTSFESRRNVCFFAISKALHS